MASFCPSIIDHGSLQGSGAHLPRAESGSAVRKLSKWMHEKVSERQSRPRSLQNLHNRWADGLPLSSDWFIVGFVYGRSAAVRPWISRIVSAQPTRLIARPSPWYLGSL